MEKFINKIIQGDTLEVLKEMPDNAFDTIITSPPYWGLRDYGTAKWIGGSKDCNHRIDRFGNRKVTSATKIDQSKQKSLAGEFVPINGICPKCGAKRIDLQIGLEKTLDEFIEKLLAITQELQRVLKPTGVMFWNHGDNYSTTPAGNQKNWEQKGGDGVYDRLYKRNQQGVATRRTSIPTKCLCLQNYRLILKMIDQQGWILRNTIIWHKPNAMPSSVKDRFSNSYEPVFMLVKKKKYWFDLDAARKPYESPINRWGGEQKDAYAGKFSGSGKESEKFNSPRARSQRKGRRANNPKLSNRNFMPAQGASLERERNLRPNKAGKNPGDVWKIATQPFPQAHFATFPEKLIIPMIKSSCPKWICKRCGRARVRISKRKGIEKGEAKNAPSDYKTIKKKPKEVASGQGETGLGGGHKRQDWLNKHPYTTIGWTKCDCQPQEYEAGLVLDPFMGSGTVGVVAKKLGRNYCGIELSKEYIKIANQRIRGQTRAML